MSATPPVQRSSVTTALAVLALLLLHVALRLPQLGHLLTWDEAMNLLSVRALAAGGHDFYSLWFWRHPPAYAVLMSVLRPLADGLALRSEVLSLAISVGLQGVLFAVVRLTFGVRAGLLACAAYALLPGAIFYDLWIKQDVLLALFGLAAIGCWLLRRPLWSGLLLGLAGLTKENAVFFAAALFLLWCLTRPRRGRDLAVLVLVPLCTAGWWYGVFSVSLRQMFGFVVNVGDPSAATWAQPWWYFFAKLPLDLGWPGLALAAVGGGVVVLLARDRAAAAPAPGPLWPLALLAPGYLLLSAMHGKVAWLNIALLPALAALQGVALDALCRRVKAPPWVPWLLVALLVLPGARLDYERFLQGQDAGVWRGAHASREAAQELNRRALPDQRVLITPMWYWSGAQQAPCPIFIQYVRPFPFLLRPNTLDADAVVREVRQQRLDWALLSPAPGADEKKMLAPLVARYGLQPIVIGGGMSCLFDVRPLRTAAPPAR